VKIKKGSIKPSLPPFKRKSPKVPLCYCTQFNCFHLRLGPCGMCPTRKTCKQGPGWVKNGRVHACTQPHTCGAPCVLNFVLFSAEEMPFDKFSYFVRSNTAIHPIFPPPPKECILPFKSSSGTKQNTYNFPWLPTAYSIKSTPAPAIWTILQCDPDFLSRPPLPRVQRLRQTPVLDTNYFYISIHACGPSFLEEPSIQGHHMKCPSHSGGPLSALTALHRAFLFPQCSS
jgi:hypothetical protein